MNYKLVEPIKNSEGGFMYYNSPEKEGVKSWTLEGNEVYYVRELENESAKFKKLAPLLERNPCKFFISLGEKLKSYLNKINYQTAAYQTLDEKLYIMVDYTDPRPLYGLAIADGEDWDKKEDLLYIAFNTEWDSIEDGEFEEIFAHEYFHLWLYLLNYSPKNHRSNKFHTVTAVTDPYTAFSEGFAEHLEPVSYQNGLEDVAQEKFSGFWDHAIDINAFLCKRDTQLRYFAVRNNRFIYNKMIPEIGQYSDFITLHLDYISSTAFLPERVKNGSQIIASEGAIATVFYQIYKHDTFKNNFLDDDFYNRFDTEKKEVSPLENLYLKMLYVMSQQDYINTTYPMIDFIKRYGENFPEEKEDLYKLFLETTHFTTVSTRASKLFSDFYLAGRRAEIEEFKRELGQIRDFKADLLEKVIRGEIELDQGLYPQIWVENLTYQIPPCPWMRDRLENYIFDLNTASIADLMSLTRLDHGKARKLIKIREENRGFSSFTEFEKLTTGLIDVDLKELDN